MAVLAHFLQNWLILGKSEGFDILRWFGTNVSAIYNFYWEKLTLSEKSQNLADYGWFFEIFAKMADSKNRWRNWVGKVRVTSINAQYPTFIEKLEAFLMNHKNWLVLAAFCFFEFFKNQPKPANFWDSSKTLRISQ